MANGGGPGWLRALMALEQQGKDYVNQSYKAQGLTDEQIKQVNAAAKPLADNANENWRLINETRKQIREAKTPEQLKKVVANAERGKNLFSFGPDRGRNIGQIAAVSEIGSGLVGEVGEGRFAVADLGLNKKDNQKYLESLETYGHLPDSAGMGYEIHRNKDGTLRVSVDEPEESLAGSIMKGVVMGAPAAILGPVASASLGGGFLGGAASGAISPITQGLVSGDMDLGDVAKGAVTGGLMASGKDFFADAIKSNRTSVIRDYLTDADGNYIGREGLPDSFQDLPLNEDQLRNIYEHGQTSDFGKLFGEHGLLGGDYISTKPVDWALEQADKVVSKIPGADWVADKLFGGKLDPSTMTEKDWQEAIAGNYDERFYDFISPRGDSPLYGIHEVSPGGTGDSFTEAFKKMWKSGGPTLSDPNLGDILLPNLGDTPNWLGLGQDVLDEVRNPSDKPKLPQGEKNTGYTPISDEIFEVPSQPEFNPPDPAEPTEELPLEGDPELEYGELPPELGEPTEELPPIDSEKLPPTPPEGEREEINERPTLPSSTTWTTPKGGGGPVYGPGDPSGSLYDDPNKTESGLFRLARVMGIDPSGVDFERMRKEAVTGDATAVVDKLSSEYIQRWISDAKAREQEEKRMFKELQERAERALKTEGRGRGRG